MGWLSDCLHQRRDDIEKNMQLQRLLDQAAQEVEAITEARWRAATEQRLANEEVSAEEAAEQRNRTQTHATVYCLMTLDCGRAP